MNCHNFSYLNFWNFGTSAISAICAIRVFVVLRHRCRLKNMKTYQTLFTRIQSTWISGCFISKHFPNNTRISSSVSNMSMIPLQNKHRLQEKCPLILQHSDAREQLPQSANELAASRRSFSLTTHKLLKKVRIPGIKDYSFPRRIAPSFPRGFRDTMIFQCHLFVSIC